MAGTPEIEIRECKTVGELADCVTLQRSVFTLPEVEISPVRHFVVTMHAGGFTLGAFDKGRLVGFVLSVPAFLNGERAFYSHMAAVDSAFQGAGIGARLKWAQRERSLAEGVGYIKWTFQPVQARNAYFNLEKLGATVANYVPDFYGTDYMTLPHQLPELGMESDRLIAEWHLEGEKPKSLADGKGWIESRAPVRKIVTTNEWPRLLSEEPLEAKKVQNRIREEFLDAFEQGLVCEAFERHPEQPSFLFFEKE
ncbi:MAG: GNAT family N-acetyltransferase [Acidobacteria bacterium]|nr:MAG: GNAT family N-acetyltransferase [Acidobacteriota bacterium]REK02406.1 MAG: GNAT family N-acetyltransferase [Acidobacteriota bacterium]REK13792.1 MAG: GNAT family N-acetyltransferase [Acidobacteriota bacterium]REK41786.1 MAG: GNAT family N-acetyltransferase [Acidobacteriota bacterium]